MREFAIEARAGASKGTRHRPATARYISGVSIVVVGLGPGSPDALTVAGQRALAEAERLFVRTRLHPALSSLTARFESFDELFDAAESTDELPGQIADRLMAAQPCTYAIPGDGSFGDAALAVLRDRGVDVRIVPGLAEATAAVAAAGLVASDALQVVDALSVGGTNIDRGFEPNPRYPLVVTGLYSPALLAEVKLSLLEVYPADGSATMVYHPGQLDERVQAISLAQLDRETAAVDHLTSLVVEPVLADFPGGSPQNLRAIIAHLRAPEGGCPWDLEQTHLSLKPFMLEEAYEVAEAIEDEDSSHLMEELGDVLLQVYLHAEMADQEGDFSLNDVFRAISEKLIRRHPHVFADITVSDASEVVQNWDALKAAEKAGQPQPTSALDGINRTLPGLKLASETARKAEKAGFAWDSRDGALAKVREELDELLGANSVADRREELGDLLWMLAHLAQIDGIDAEDAVRLANRKFTARFQVLERLASEKGWDGLKGRGEAALLDLWRQAKAEVAALPSSPNEQ
jgi:tetrapyrrole methylase family protein/MazG family protein